MAAASSNASQPLVRVSRARPSAWHPTVSLALAAAATLLGVILTLADAQPAAARAAYLAAVVFAGYPIVRKGIAAARRMQLDMNALMTLAVVGALAIDEWLEAATVVVLFALAQRLESASMERARGAVRALMSLAPSEATVLQDGVQVRLPTRAVEVGATVLVRPGERIGLDGEVRSGRSTVNEAPVTGEAIGVPKGPGDIVYAGSVNEAGALEVRVARPADDSTLARIVRLVEAAAKRRAPVQRFVDRFAAWYTPLVIAGAVGLAILPTVVWDAPFTPWFYRALVLLVVACPCALVISTPVAVVSGLTAAARAGVLIKGGASLERAGAIRAVALDKTGTLTLGQPVLEGVIPFGDHTREEVLGLAASVEAQSEHHIARAILAGAPQQDTASREGALFQALAGRGAVLEMGGRTLVLGNHRLIEERGICSPVVHDELERLEATGRTAAVLGDDREVIGLLALSDVPRPEAREALGKLRALGVERIVMLTGDSRGAAEAIARELDVDEVHAELLPEDKVRIVERLGERYGSVAMIGDGVNDAPALAASTLGIAMGVAGTDVALETADVALMADDLAKVPEAIALSRRALGIIRQNIGAALVLKLSFLALAVGGLATLWMAVMADVGATLVVIGNGLRLLRARSAL